MVQKKNVIVKEEILDNVMCTGTILYQSPPSCQDNNYYILQLNH